MQFIQNIPVMDTLQTIQNILVLTKYSSAGYQEISISLFTDKGHHLSKNYPFASRSGISLSCGKCGAVLCWDSCIFKCCEGLLTMFSIHVLICISIPTFQCLNHQQQTCYTLI